MNNNNSSCESGKAVKRIREGDDTTTAAPDRLSHLPDFIIHHILSFLDTRWAVQTSVLSRSWRSAWKHVPVLNLDSLWFRKYSIFQRFVDNVLSLRHPFKVHEMSFIEEDDEERDVSFIVKVAKYALSHGTHHLEFKLLGSRGYNDTYRFSNLFGTISNCDLKTLELVGVCIDNGFGSSRLQMLTTLNLTWCTLTSDQNGVCNPFSNCPCLEKLILNDCRHWDWQESDLKIFAPQLRSLYMDNVDWFANVEIFTPRLKSFDFNSVLKELKFSKLTISSLDLAVIRIYDEADSMEGNEESVTQRLISLFQGLSNVTTLRLEPGTIKVLFWFIFVVMKCCLCEFWLTFEIGFCSLQALSSINSEFLEQQSSPFTRLKTLIVDADQVPYLPITYFLEGSSVAEPTIEFVYYDTGYFPWIVSVASRVTQIAVP
ncbi:unnamed protein product [Linum tenue]|uniref:F-box domain-containing protein n=1 Tax=Linum tenue TaxID=586396 RepID=A0AAV0Q3X4_9ROSI|nr:unnamed protein product [Linum tenue]